MADTLVDATVMTDLNIRNLRMGPVWIDENTGYLVYIDSASDVVYQKTGDGGANWAAPVVVKTGTARKLSIWFDKWTSGDSGTKIHMAYMDAATHDVFYRTLDVSGDSIGTERTVFAGVSFTLTNWYTSVIDITKARSGYLYIGFWGDTAGEFGFYRSVDAGVNWVGRAQLADGNEVDFILLMPGNEADTNDIWCFYWDRSASEISLKIYDNSGNSWSETAIANGTLTSNANFYPMSAASRHSDDHVILVYWNLYNNAAADLQVWDIGGSGDMTAKTDVLTNQNAAVNVTVFINQQNDDIYVAYIRGTIFSLVDVYWQKSADGGGSWGGEQAYSEAVNDDFRGVWAGISVGNDGGKFQPAFYNHDDNDLFVNIVNDVDIAGGGGGAVPIPFPLRYDRQQSMPTFAPIL